MSGVLIDKLTKSFGDTQVLRGIDLDVQDGEFFALLGPSGCGKTTALRVVAGLERPDSGRVLLGGSPVTDPATGLFVAPERRELGMMFQSYAVWPHMTAERNVAYPLRVRGVARSERRRRAAEMLEMVGLADLGHRLPRELSGGQQQRVALGRALIARPKVLLLDEPLSNLDARLRVRMREEIRSLQQRLGITVLYVTHDQDEAFAMSDRVAVMNLGTILQVGTAEEVKERPADDFVREFLG